jgi:hypothetical protein
VHLGFHVPGLAGDRREQRRAVADDDVGKLQPARADLREVIVEPARQRGVEVDDVAMAVDREEAGGPGSPQMLLESI